MSAAYMVGGALVVGAAWAAILLMIASGFRIAANARIEDERLKARQEMLRRADRLGMARAKEILRHAVFSWRVELVDETERSAKH